MKVELNILIPYHIVVAAIHKVAADYSERVFVVGEDSGLTDYVWDILKHLDLAVDPVVDSPKAGEQNETQHEGT